MLESYAAGAKVLREGGTAAEALAKVPTVTRVNHVMWGRRQPSGIETHHTATVEWTRELIPDITDNELNKMPAFLMDDLLHRDPDNILVKQRAFHRILEDEMATLPAGAVDNAAILDRLERTYRVFFNLGPSDPAPDVWVVTRAWLTTKGV